MNYCTRCASYYHVAGTCNCYAPPVAVQPVIPSPTSQPTIIPAPYVGDPPYTPGQYPYVSPATTSITWSGGSTSPISLKALVSFNEHGDMLINDVKVQTEFTA